MTDQNPSHSIKPRNCDEASKAVLGAPLMRLHASGAEEHEDDFAEFAQALRDSGQTVLVEELDKDEQLGSFLRAVISLSPYLRTLCKQFPEVVGACRTTTFSAALDGSLLSMNLEGEDLLDEKQVMCRLRTAKRHVALICGLADLGGWWGSDDIGKLISDTADHALKTVVKHLLLKAHYAGKIALPDVSEPVVGSGYCVLAMGKHGAGELNYSSDIDLIVFFDPVAPAVIDRDDSVAMFGRLTRALVKIMQDWTEDGYVFRTDLRLRPDPGSMPVAIPVDLAMHYYESRGQNWERAALIKARAVAGDMEVGERILDELKPFIWRRYLDYAAIADVHSIKRQIQAHKGYTALHVPGHNVKLGRGGIREIEFFVQTQQLIAGGREPDLRGRGTLQMLDMLVEKSWVDEKVSVELKESYLYLRDVEHRLQMINDAQTHTIPEDDDGLLKIAQMCGFETSSEFEAATAQHLNRVEAHYADLFAQEPELTAKLGNLSFTGDDDDPGTLETLGQLGFDRPSAMIAVIRGWHFGRYRAMQSVDARERLTELTPLLLGCFADTGKPDDALIAFDEFLKGLPAGFQLFNLLKANPDLLNLLVLVLGAAPRLAAIITRKPHVFDGLLEPGFFNADISDDVLRDRLANALSSTLNYEDGLDRARQFAAEQRFLIGIRVLSGALPIGQAGQAYATLADVMVQAMLDFVRAEFESRHGKIGGANLAVVGMGNLGTRELTAGSDLDLIALYEFDEENDTSDGERPLHASQYFGRLTQRLIAAMSAPTAEGVIYELDFRLRPSGNSGPLATTLMSFSRYQKNEAWTWERLAMTRARAIAGEPEFLNRVQGEVRASITGDTRARAVPKEIIDMRFLMDKERPPKSIWDVKLAQGGLVDLEFLAQWAILLGEAPPGSTTREVLAAITFGEAAADDLVEAYDFFVTILQISRICLTETVDPENAPAGLLEILLRVLNMPDIRSAEVELKRFQEMVRRSFKAALVDQPS